MCSINVYRLVGGKVHATNAHRILYVEKKGYESVNSLTRIYCVFFVVVFILEEKKRHTQTWC